MALFTRQNCAVRRLSRVVATGALLAAMVACTPETPPREPPRIDRVIQRLGPGSFSDVPVPLHGPVAQIGDEARPVVRGPEEVLVAEVFSVIPKDGEALVDIELAPEVVGLPDSAFVLTIQELPFTQELATEVMAHIARENFALRRDQGWRLRRDADADHATLEVDHEGDQAVQMNLRLTALLGVPASLESKPFELAAGARLVLGYGLTGARETEDTKSVDFVATVTCTDVPARELLRTSIPLGARQASRWEDAEATFDEAASGCRLVLENEASDGQPLGAVWAVPQILASDSASAQDTNLILISLDTLRSDHLSGLGYGRDTSPIIDAQMIDKGTTFTDTSSTFPQTDVSHLSIFTGLYPSAQPKRGRVSPSDRLVMLAELLQRAGLETSAYTEDALVSGAFGFWFGFDQFTERSFAHADRGRPTIEDGIRYLEKNRDRRFFLFLHTYKTHDPYVPGPEYEALWSGEEAWRDGGPAPWIPEKHREILDRYDRTIREADALVGQLLAALDDLGLADRTFVVVTSDHGEAFGEHGIAGHGFTPHQEALDVPLIFRGPGVPANRRIETPVSIADLTPTLLDLLAVEPTAQSQGVSLAPALAGEPLPGDRPIFFSWLRPDASGFRRKNQKFHRTAQGSERFDLEADPFEWKPDRGEPARTAGEKLLGEHAAQARRLREELGPTETNAPSPPAIDKRLEKSLEALGYL